MIKYYPLTRIKTNLYTRGTTYAVKGKPYTGKYYLTYEGKAYAGSNPILGTNQELTLLKQTTNSDSPKIGADPTIAGNYEFNQYTKAKSQNGEGTSLTNLEELQPYYPVVIESDYQAGYFTRYFAKNVTGPNYIIEISQNDYSNVKNNLYGNTYVYEIATLLWQLVGPLKDTRVSQYQIKGGVYDTNKRVTEAKNIGFRGIVDFIGGDYIKYARVTP